MWTANIKSAKRKYWSRDETHRISANLWRKRSRNRSGFTSIGSKTPAFFARSNLLFKFIVRSPVCFFQSTTCWSRLKKHMCLGGFHVHHFPERVWSSEFFQTVEKRLENMFCGIRRKNVLKMTQNRQEMCICRTYILFFLVFLSKIWKSTLFFFFCKHSFIFLFTQLTSIHFLSSFGRPKPSYKVSLPRHIRTPYITKIRKQKGEKKKEKERKCEKTWLQNGVMYVYLKSARR